MLFPAAFLLFCMPLATYLDVVTVHLRLLASGVAFAVLKGFGADVVQTGTSIAAADGSFAIDVADPCGGLRSLFALMALTAGYAYFNQPTWLRRALLFAASVPIAIVGNVFRILSICLVAAFASGEFATGFYHDYSGFVVFIVAIALMVGTGELISKIFSRRSERKSAETLPVSTPKPPLPPGRFSAVIPVLTVLIVTVTMWRQFASPEAVVAELPVVTLPEIAGYEREDVEISEAELTILPKDTKISKIRYIDSAGEWHVVSVVIGGVSKQSIHRPELCLPAQGYLMSSPRSGVSAGGVEWRLLTLKKGDSCDQGFAYTFFNQEGYRTSSHIKRILRDVWDRTVYNRIDRWVMITVNSSCHEDGRLLEFLSKLEGMLK
jgi:exosortase/archaeosortase family protein